MRYSTNNSIGVNIKITLQVGSTDNPEINYRIICKKELYKVDPVLQGGKFESALPFQIFVEGKGLVERPPPPPRPSFRNLLYMNFLKDANMLIFVNETKRFVL